MRPGMQKKGAFVCMSGQNCLSIFKGYKLYHLMKGNQNHFKDFYTCNNCNVIYLQKCQCGKVYIGQTSQAIKNKFKRTLF